MNTGSMSGEITADVLVVGGGAAGMMAAREAAACGANTLLIEKNEKLGKKLYITGKGRCNVTNTADFDAFLRETPRNPRFLSSALHALDHEALRGLLAQYGTPTKVERGGRVFPVSDKASDVTRALSRAMEDAGARVRLNAAVLDIRGEEGGFVLALADGGTVRARAVIVATGGLSYPSTGSTGDGYRFAAAFSHTVTPGRGVLTGLEIPERWPQLLQGLTLKNVRVRATEGKKKLFDELGELLFTHFGVGGPLILTLSSHLPEDVSRARIFLDMKPALTAEQVDLRLQRELAGGAKKRISNVLATLMPARMAPVFAGLCGLTGEETAGQITRAQRQTIGEALKALPLHAGALRPVEEAVVTRGGVEVREISPGTMMSRLAPGLFFAGEVLDVDAHTGGFNLQIAFSTGALAGRGAAAYALRRAQAQI